MRVLKKIMLFLKFPLKMNKITQMKILIFVLMFFIIGTLFIISNNNLAMYKQENIERFSELYVEWINQIYANIQAITGQVVGFDWLP